MEFKELQEKYGGQYVALQGETVLYSASTFNGIMKEIRKNVIGNDIQILHIRKVES